MTSQLSAPERASETTTPARPAPPARRWPARLILICGIALALLCDAFVGTVLYSNYRETHRAVQRADADLVRVLDEYTQRTIQAIDLSLRVTANQIAADPALMTPGNPALIAALKRTISMYSAVQALVVLDADGNLVADSLGNGVPGRQFNFADRVYYQMHRDRAVSDLFVDIPRHARANANKYFISVSRAMRGPDGKLEGVLFAALDYEQISQFFLSLDLSQNGAVTLFRGDGTLLVRVPAGEDFIGRHYDASPLFTEHLAQSPTGNFRGGNFTTSDTRARRVTYRKVNGLPFVVTVSRAEVEILSGWRDGVWKYGSAAGALNLMIVALGFFLAREWRRREASQQALTESLVQSHLVTDNVPAAIVAVDRDGRVRFANGTVAEWYRRSAGDLIGLKISDFVPQHALDQFRPGIEAVLAGKSHRAEGRVRYPDGCERWVDFNRVPDIAPDGTIRGYVSLAVDITARKEAEEALRKSEAQYRLVADNLPAGIVQVGADLRLKYANRVIEQWYARSNAELIGGKITENVPPEMLAKFRNAIEGALAGKTTREEYKMRFPDGQERWLDYTRVPDYGEDGKVRGYFGLAVDITARRQAEKKLRESEEHFRKVFEMSPDAIYVHAGGRIVVANASAAQMFGFDTVESMLGVETFSLYHPESHEKIMARRAALENNGEVQPVIEHRYTRRGGEMFTGEARAANFVWQGEPAIIVFVRDTTERRRFEEELIAARDRAEIASRAKSEFLANMSHELRTPLNAIIGFSEILIDERLAGVRPPREYATDIHESGLHLLNIINDVLDMAKIEAGKIMLEEEMIDIAVEIDAALRMVAPRADDGALALATDIERGLPLVFADRRLFKQIMLNILSNAVKFTPRGGAITVRARREAGGRLAVSVADTGIGIRQADLERVLQPFGQAESGLARRYEGTGLGLPICKALAELHGGTIEIASTPGAGTTVTVRFPADRMRRQQAA